MKLTEREIEYAKTCCELCKDDTRCPYFFLTPSGKCLCECHGLFVNETGWKAIKDSKTTKPAVRQSWEINHDQDDRLYTTVCMEPMHEFLYKRKRKW